MAVRVTDTSGEQWTIVGDECGHTNQADPSTLAYGQLMDGSPNQEIVVIPCPEPDCGTVSYWPVEALPEEVRTRLP